MEIPLYQIDAFTCRVFGGNPAAICPLETWIDDELMQKIAQENNLFETAFIVRKGKSYEIRWFTPMVEIELAGHPTLAAAFVIFHYLNHEGDEIVFESKSGELRVSREGDLISMNFPAMQLTDAGENELINGALGKKPLELYKTRDFLAVYRSEDEIASLEPDYMILRMLDCLGMIVTAPGREADFVSRFFAPSLGIKEDPVTGSAYSTLVPYWAGRLNKNDLHAFQLSRRRGELFCKYLGESVEVGGKAVPYLKGIISI